MMIECRNLRKVYRNGDIDTIALESVSFGIEKGEFVAIIGPSGSGKSSLMHILGALDTPTSGDYLFDGRNISGFNEEELSDMRRDSIGFVFQAFNLLPRMSVLRNVMLPLLYSNLPIDERMNRARSALALAQVEESNFSHLSNQLSGGQMQRVAIARALVRKPELILADEPTGNLDTRTSQMIMRMFRELNQQGNTIILITHEMEVARFAKRIVSVRDGRIESDTLL